MAKKVLYLGNGKWCWTETCKRHAVIITHKKAYADAVALGDAAGIKKAERVLLSTEAGFLTHRYMLIQSETVTLKRKPLIGLDLDGTTGDFTHALRGYMGAGLKIPKKEWVARFPDPEEYAMWTGGNAWYTSKEDFLNHFKTAETKGLYGNVPIYENATRVLNELKNFGFNIKVITARGAEFNHDTRAWMEKHKVPVETILNPGTEKQNVQNVDVYIDDAPHVVNKLLEHDKKVVVMNQSYNGHTIDPHENARRVNNWDGDNVVNAIFDLIDGKKDK